MLTKIRHRLQQEEGFTLIELLVVILIIGILAAVAIPTFLSQKNKATDSNAQSNLKNAQTIVEAYADGLNGQYPAAAVAAPSATTPGGGTGQLSTSLTGDSDAISLSSGGQTVYYDTQNNGSATTGTSSADTYQICAEGDSTNPTWWAIIVKNGATTYGVSQGTGSTCAKAEADSTPSTSGFPSVTS